MPSMSSEEMSKMLAERRAKIEETLKNEAAKGPRFMNDDYEVVPCRTAAKISEAELRELIIEEANRISPVKHRVDDVYRPWTDAEISEDPDGYIQSCIESFFELDDDEAAAILMQQYFGCTTFDEDEDEDDDDFDDVCVCSLGTFELNTALCFANIYYGNSAKQFFRYSAEKVTGFHTLPNGLTFCGFFLQEENYPLVVILYFDGEKLRLYIPRWGNCIHKDEMYIWFWGGDEWDRYEYYAKYGFDSDDMVLNDEAMLKDISIAIQVAE